MLFIEELFDIESTENCEDNTMMIERSIDYGEGEDNKRLTRQEIDELKHEIERVDKIINKK